MTALAAPSLTDPARPGEQAASRASRRVTTACTHCGLDVPAGLISATEPNQFCCEGCRLVYSTIHSCGLDNYYAIRQRLGATGRRATLAASSSADAAFAEFDDPAFLEVYATSPAPAATAHAATPQPAAVRADLLLENVHCAACLWLVERLPHLLEGVRSARLDLRRAVVTIEWEPSRVRLSAVARALASLGYRPHAVTDSSAQDARRRQDRAYLIRIGVAAACSGNAMLLAFALYSGDFAGMSPAYAIAFRWLSVAIGAVSLLWPGRVFLDSASAALRARVWHLDTPIALALIVGNLASLIAAIRSTNDLYVDSLTMLVFLLLVGRWMQLRQQRHALDAVELLFCLAPGAAHLVDDPDHDGPNAPTRDVAVQSLQPGQTVEVRPQETFPIDGIIVHGSTTIDSSILTGESRPIPTALGQGVIAGAINLASTVHVRATAVGKQTRAGRMMATIEELSRRRTPIVGSAQRLAAPFVIAVLALASITFALHAREGLAPALRHTIALLVSTCPCAVALATPLVVTIAVGRAARAGVLVKGGDVFERLAKPGLIVLDKTGTLTTGQFRVLDWIGDQSLRPLVAALESGSTHPIALALAARLVPPIAALRDRCSELSPAPIDPAEFLGPITHVLGRGVIAQHQGRTLHVGSPAWIAGLGASIPEWVAAAIHDARARAHTPVVVAVNSRVEALAILGDQTRSDARAALDDLRAAGWRIAMLSGDDAGVVAAVARELAIDPALAWGGATPEAKQQRIVALVAAATRPGTRPAPIVMVGDGVNDAAALIAATVGIAVRGGAEPSLAAADVYIERGGLAPIPELHRAARRVMASIRLCLGVAIAYNLLAAGLAMAGLLSPLIAAAMMPLSSISILTIAIRSRTIARGARA